MNGLQGNCRILLIDIAWSITKLGIILENKVCQNMTLVKVVHLPTKMKKIIKMIFDA